MRARTFATTASAWRMCFVGLILVGLLAGPAMADKAISKIGITKDTERIVIGVQADHPLRMSVITSTRGRFVGFQFPCRLEAKGHRVSVHSGGISNVRYGSFTSRPPSTRIVVNTTRFLHYSTSWTEDRHSVQISIWKPGSRVASAQAKVADVVARVAGSVQITSAPVAIAPPFARVAQVVSGAATPLLRTDTGSKPSARMQPAIDEPPVEVAVVPVSTPAVVLDRKVSLNFLGADINDVLKALSVQSGENIVASKDVTGNVTVSLSDVKIEEALDYVAKLSGYSYAKDKGTYLVGSKDALRNMIGGTNTAPKTEVISLSYSDPDDIMALLKSQYPSMQTTKSAASTAAGPAGAAPAKSTGGYIVLSGSESLVDEAKQLIAQVETTLEAKAADEQVQVYEVKHVSPFELQKTLEALVPDVRIVVAPSDGFDLIAPEAVKVGGASSAGGATVTHSEIKKDPNEMGRVQALVLYGTEPAVDKAARLASQLDKKSPQIKIEAKITSLTESGEKQLGLSWEWSSFTFLEGTNAKGGGNLAWARQPFDFAATLDALIKNGNGKLLASPTLLCVEGQPSMFFVGDEIRYIVLVQVTATGTNVTTETANVGVQLRVNADVSPDGYITMNLHPEVSTLKLTEDKDAGITLPFISRRFTDHVVRVKDGETIVIGGLIRDDEIDEMSKVPILGDIPLLGQLFRHRSKTKSHSEVVMFIKASLVND